MTIFESEEEWIRLGSSGIEEEIVGSDGSGDNRTISGLNPGEVLTGETEPPAVETVPETKGETAAVTEAAETTATETTLKVSEAEEPGILSSGWLYGGIALVVAILLAVLWKRYAEAQKKKERRKRRQKREHQERKARQEQKPRPENPEKKVRQEKQEPIAAAQIPVTVTQPNMSAEPEMVRPAPAPVETVQSAPVQVEMPETPPTVVDVVQPASGMRSAVFQDIGAREDQQDSYGMTDPALYFQQGMLAVVADGMGGLANGKAVSSALVNTFLGEYRSVYGYDRPQNVLLELAIRANNRINQMLSGADRSGSTLVSVLIRNGYMHFLTVGDSRIYLYRSGVLMQLNREHIYQEELAVKAVNCQVPIAQVAGDRQAHSLTSFFGIGRIPYMDRNDEGIKLVEGDRILLCSDGVFGTLTQEQMEQALRCEVREAAAIMKDMIREAGKPYQDNNTGLILEYLG